MVVGETMKCIAYRLPDHGSPHFQRQQDTVYLAPFCGLRCWIPSVIPDQPVFFEFLSQQWMLFGALVVAVAMLWQHESRKSGQSLTPQQAINLVNSEDGIFLDLRESGEFGGGHIANALNIPATKIDARLAELEKHREKPIVLVCKMGQHSGAVGKKLQAQGYSKVYRMTGGMMEWGQLQLPLVKG